MYARVVFLLILSIASCSTLKDLIIEAVDENNNIFSQLETKKPERYHVREVITSTICKIFYKLQAHSVHETWKRVARQILVHYRIQVSRNVYKDITQELQNVFTKHNVPFYENTNSLLERTTGSLAKASNREIRKDWSEVIPIALHVILSDRSFKETACILRKAPKWKIQDISGDLEVQDVIQSPEESIQKTQNETTLESNTDLEPTLASEEEPVMFACDFESILGNGNPFDYPSDIPLIRSFDAPHHFFSEFSAQNDFSPSGVPLASFVPLDPLDFEY